LLAYTRILLVLFSLFAVMRAEAGVLYGTGIGHIISYDITTGQQVGVFPSGVHYEGGIAFGPDGLLYGTGIGNIISYDITTGQQVGVFPSGVHYEGGIAFGPDGLLYGTGIGNIISYDITTGQQVDVFPSGVHYEGGITFKPNGTPVPEPATVILLTIGLAGFVYQLHKRAERSSSSVIFAKG